MARPSRTPRRHAAALSSLLLTVAGCSFVPKSKLEDCHRLTQTLRADNTRLKDMALDLRAQNQELTQRAVDDARRLSAQQEAVERLESSVQAYQAERDKLADAYEAIKRQVQIAATTKPTAALDQRLRDFASARTGWVFEPAGAGGVGTLAAPADRLFEPGSARLKSAAGSDLQALAEALKGALPEGQGLEVVGRTGDPDGVRRTDFREGDGGAKPPAAAPATGRFLGAARASRVREALLSATGLNPGQVRLAPPGGPNGPPTPDGRVEVRVVRLGGGLDAGVAPDK